MCSHVDDIAWAVHGTDSTLSRGSLNLVQCGSFVVKNLYRFVARIERVVYYCDSSILLCLHGSPRDPARGHPSLSQACVTHWPICMCNMYCASPRILKDARATKNYDVLKCPWIASGFPIRIGSLVTEAPSEF